jgi:GT2 family glycosyltransferase
MKIRALVPRLSDNGERDRLWEYCRAHWADQLPAMEIVEGHHEGDGPFNRSAAVNFAAEGEWDFAVVLDADVIADAEQVTSAIGLAKETGELVLPYTMRHMLSAQGTEQILDGYQGNWNGWTAARERDRVSCCVIVPRALWDAVGGFDERFEGWGGEDEAFYNACRTVAGARRLPGTVWHLHHTASPHNNTSTPLYRQALRLAQRYERATDDRNAMQHLLAEPRTPDQIALLVLTTGDRDTLEATLDSAMGRLKGPIGRRLICVDGPPSRVETVEGAYPSWEVERIRGGGYPKAVAAAIERAIGSGQPWIFWLEDDFIFNEPVDLRGMQALVEKHDLAQLSLMRQPWYEHEVEAGGVIAARPDEFIQRDGYIEHRAYWTTNPMLTSRQFLAEHRWPMGRNSELRFGHSVFSDPRVCAGILGEIEDGPRVHHIGLERAGKGY